MLPSLAIKQRALDLGFDLAGIAPIAVWKDLEFSRQWVEKGFHGDMRYLENPKRFDPYLVLPSAKSVICVGLVYNFPFSSFHFPVSAAAAPSAWISRYAWGQDYHGIMRAKLEQLRAAVEEFGPGVETRVFVDTGPVVERAFARFSGIGWMGKNTCIINEEKGSWFFLGVILTSLELAPDLPAPDRCGSCRACLKACPTEALVEPYVMDASRCISYLTIEIKGAIPERFRSKIGANVFGCDICQDVCPWNSSRQSSVVSGPLSVVSGPSSVVSGPSSVVSRQSSVISRQPSAISYQQAPSKRQQPPDQHYIAHPPTTKVPQFHPLTVATILPPTEEGSARKQLTTGHGRRTTDHGLRTTDHGRLTTDHGQRTSDQGRLTTDHGPRTTDNGRRTTDTTSFSLCAPPLAALASLSEKDFRRIFARSPIKRAKYRGWLRNLCVAMGNSDDERFVPWLEQAAQHPDPIVREHAIWALGRLQKK
jgi:epoxyqueuosine reductase